MTDKPLRQPLADALASIENWLSEARIPHVVIGGVAASLLSRPRFTKDADVLVLIPPEGWDGFIDSATKHGITPRISQALEFARKSRVFLLRHDRTGIDVDVSAGALPFEIEAVERRTVMDVGGIRLPLASPEDLIVMKAIARRPQDILDIQALAQAHPKVDLERIRGIVGEFADLLEIPEIKSDLEEALRRAREP